MTTFRGWLSLALVSFLALLATAQPASAITGGEPDGDRHPSVGLILFYDPDGRSRCSATLVSPTVLVTAAHCTAGTLGRTLVTFDPVIAERPPSPLPVAKDPSVGFTQEEIEEAGFRSGTAVAHPDYSDFTDLSSWNDVGVILLDQPAAGIEPARLTPLNHLDQFAQRRLSSTLFTAVGYGTEVRKPDSGPQKPEPMDYPLIRRTTTAPGQKLTPQILQLNGNPNDSRGGGGICFGDSGGPLFLDGYLVAVTSYVTRQHCRYAGGFQRVDIAVVQDWLAGVAG